MMKLPEFTVFHGDDEVPCRYEYDAGEEQWFDARAGVGSPGYPGGAWVTEVCIAGQWIDVESELFTQEQRDQWDQRITDLIIEHESAINAERDEAEYEAWQESKKWGEFE
jgi:hypothetical protein